MIDGAKVGLRRSADGIIAAQKANVLEGNLPEKSKMACWREGWNTVARTDPKG